MSWINGDGGLDLFTEQILTEGPLDDIDFILLL